MSEPEEKTVKLVVFLSEEERTRFKVACAQNRITMSQQARGLILEWLDAEENKPSPSKLDKGE